MLPLWSQFPDPDRVRRVFNELASSRRRSPRLERPMAKVGSTTTRQPSEPTTFSNNDGGDLLVAFQSPNSESSCDWPAPNPYTNATLLAFDRTEDIASIIKEHRTTNPSPCPCEAAGRLMRDGLRWNSIGMDFSEVLRRRGLGADEDMRALLNHYWAHCRSCLPLFEWEFARHRHRYPMSTVSLISGRYAELQKFRRDGFLLFDDLGVDIDQVLAAAERAWNVGPKSHEQAVSARSTQLPGIEKVIKNQEILELSSAYLGADARLAGYKIIRIGSRVGIKEYISGRWHHDGCGSRLKLFLLLQDVTGDDGAPTEVARGSQNMVYYRYFQTAGYRFRNDYVARTYDIRPMLGRKGGGFVFDTNTVHRGKVSTKHLRRDAVVFDIESIDKVSRGLMAHSVCPEPGIFPVRNRIWRHNTTARRRAL